MVLGKENVRAACPKDKLEFNFFRALSISTAHHILAALKLIGIHQNSPSSFSAMLLLPIFSKTSERWPTVAFFPSFCFHTIKRACALCQLPLFSSSILCIFDSAILSLGPSWRQQVPTASLISATCFSETTSFLGLTVVVSNKIKNNYNQDYTENDNTW